YQNDGQSAQTYTITTSLIPDPDPDRFEPNDNFDKAVKIELGQIITATIAPQKDNDYFKLNIPKKGTFSAVVSEVPKEINPFFAMYDSNKEWMRSARGDYGQGVSIQFTSLPAGDYYLRLCAQDDGQSAQAYKLTTNFGSPEITLPMAKITSPQPNSLLSDTITILGTATAENFLNYVFQYGTGSTPTSWLTIATSTTPVINGTLATWNTTLLEDGTYTLCLTVKDKLNNIATDTVVIGIDNTPPVLQITYPVNNSIIMQATIPVTGTADDEHLLNWTLEYGAGYTPQTYTLVASSTISVISGTLGSIFLPTGSYTLKLTAKDITNKIATHTVSFIIIQAMPTPAEILQKVADNLNKINDMKAEITNWGTSTITGWGTVTIKTFGPTQKTYLEKKPDKIKIESPTENMAYIIDGDVMYVKLFGVWNPWTKISETFGINPSELNILSPEYLQANEVIIKEYLNTSEGNIYILETTPKGTETGKWKMISYINYDKGIVTKSETYDVENNLIGSVEYSEFILDSSSSAWLATKCINRDMWEGFSKVTETIYSNIQINTGIPDSEFEPVFE
ncbi:MAG: Ig-like domain-containing protein, partial [bacterium]